MASLQDLGHAFIDCAVLDITQQFQPLTRGRYLDSGSASCGQGARPTRQQALYQPRTRSVNSPSADGQRPQPRWDRPVPICVHSSFFEFCSTYTAFKVRSASLRTRGKDVAHYTLRLLVDVGMRPRSPRPRHHPLAPATPLELGRSSIGNRRSSPLTGSFSRFHLHRRT